MRTAADETTRVAADIGCLLWERQTTERDTRFVEVNEDLLRRVLLSDGVGDLLQDERADRASVVLDRVGKGLDHPDAAGSVLALDGQGEVADLLKILVGPGSPRVLGLIVGPEGQISLGGEDLKLLQESADELVIQELLSGDLIHQLATVETPDSPTADALLTFVDGLQDLDVVPASHRSGSSKQEILDVATRCQSLAAYSHSGAYQPRLRSLRNPARQRPSRAS